MELDFLGNSGWREALMAIVGLLVLYMAFVLLRMRHLKHEALRAQESAPIPFAVASAVAAYSVAESVVAPAELADGARPGELGSPEFQFPWNEPPAENARVFRDESLSLDVEQLRKEVGALRAEVLVLREALQRPPPPVVVEEPRQASLAEMIAPQYSEAMQLARKAVDPADISLQCGITRAEAELVAALVRNRDN